MRFSGVSFQIYTHDHLPRNVDARYAGKRLILEFGQAA